MACALTGASHTAHAQARYTASRSGDLQIGAGYSNADSDYESHRFVGYSVYGTYDFFRHIGVGFDFHQVNVHGESNHNFDDLYERTYEVGARYVWHIRRVNPYVKINYGRGVFNYPRNTGPANLAYNIWAPGVGADVRILRHVNARVDYEFQNWMGFSKKSDLEPSILTVGAAYHF